MMANERPMPNDKLHDKYSSLPLNKNCATEANENDKNIKVPNISAKNLRNVSF